MTLRTYVFINYRMYHIYRDVFRVRLSPGYLSGDIMFCMVSGVIRNLPLLTHYTGLSPSQQRFQKWVLLSIIDNVGCGERRWTSVTVIKTP